MKLAGFLVHSAEPARKWNGTVNGGCGLRTHIDWSNLDDDSHGSN